MIRSIVNRQRVDRQGIRNNSRSAVTDRQRVDRHVSNLQSRGCRVQSWEVGGDRLDGLWERLFQEQRTRARAQLDCGTPAKGEETAAARGPRLGLIWVVAAGGSFATADMQRSGQALQRALLMAPDFAVLVMLNKRDLPDAVCAEEAKRLLAWSELSASHPMRLHMMECDAISRPASLLGLIPWLEENAGLPRFLEATSPGLDGSVAELVLE